jgi:hypothetical protein
MHRRVFLSAALMVSSLYSLEETPWLDNTYQFNLLQDVTYSRYRYIDHAVEQPSYAYNNYLTRTRLSLSPSQDFQVELEFEMARTPHQLYGFRSIAVGVRYSLFDDIAGDPLSVVLGGNLRPVGGRAVRDVSSPYGSYMNYEVMVSLGKEFLSDKTWKLRGYLVGTFGLANHGSCWDRFYGALEGKFLSSQVLKAFISGYYGYGMHRTVDIEHFRGWGRIDHGSIDLGVEYRYIFDFWGELGLSYGHRVLARSYPQNEQTFTLSYKLPFSLF